MSAQHTPGNWRAELRSGFAYAELAHVSRTQINARLQQRSRNLQALRNDLKDIVRNGRLDAQEMQDMVCCLKECSADLRKDAIDIKASLLDLSCDLDSLIHYGSDE